MSEGETTDVLIGDSGAFIRFRRATELDRKNFDAWLASERDEQKEFPAPLAAGFKPLDHRQSVRWWLLQRCALDHFICFSNGFENDKAIIELLDLADASGAAKATPAGIIKLLLTLPTIADAVQKAIGVSFDSVLDFLAPQKKELSHDHRQRLN